MNEIISAIKLLPNLLIIFISVPYFNDSSIQRLHLHKILLYKQVEELIAAATAGR